MKENRKLDYLHGLRLAGDVSEDDSADNGISVLTFDGNVYVGVRGKIFFKAPEREFLGRLDNMVSVGHIGPFQYDSIHEVYQKSKPDNSRMFSKEDMD